MNREEHLTQAHMIEQQTIEIKPLQTDGFILDLGGIIGKLNGTQIAAINKHSSEPDETIESGYGVKLKKQTPQTLRELAEETGFKTTKKRDRRTHILPGTGEIGQTVILYLS